MISPAIQTQKDDLKGQLSRLYDGPELREHRVRHTHFAGLNIIHAHENGTYGWIVIVVRSPGRLHARWCVWTKSPLLICKRQRHVVEDR
jgi:hypothetical protein